ncbi:MULTISPECIES: YtzI protein [unclassified Bacillus (in: firmicutes)]|uniref:YtzI protein n=1 Tax=unclassified Bacillus (in: firmicutes) TaxID=185979 RepID=UPI0008DFC2EA|nr:MULTISPECIES: YtzI protein [unclassified Bacillus (in: firmicutes)]SFB18368.1 Tumour necrosis factor receptor superfamily member 19 [Bacillus sp. UNCCL13]SFQ76080.1 Tumour necrosis factor receptor superfamily member 19 [Bacillus sp. cl95]
MYTVLVVSIIIVVIVLLLSVITTSKAYDFKHSVDPLEDNPHLSNQEENTTDPNKKS